MSRAHWAVIPAAGVGRRMGSAVPKQYLDLAGRSVIERTLEPLLAADWIAGVVVVLGAEDGYWAETGCAEHPKILRAEGGAERCHSVLNGLRVLAERADADDWVLVHDAARPCVRAEDLATLTATLADDAVGGLLAVPVRDTMKRAAGSAGRIETTVERADLWHAYTPQMFPLALLRRALETALAAGELVTDDASAIEHLGLRPRLVEGHADNLKITRAEDLALARFYLEQQGRLT